MCATTGCKRIATQEKIQPNDQQNHTHINHIRQSGESPCKLNYTKKTAKKKTKQNTKSLDGNLFRVTMT
jgi:hypothetical protein